MKPVHDYNVSRDTGVPLPLCQKNPFGTKLVLQGGN